MTEANEKIEVTQFIHHMKKEQKTSFVWPFLSIS